MRNKKISPETRLFEEDLAGYGAQGVVTSLTVYEVTGGFEVDVTLLFNEAKVWTVVTQRNRHQPKIFKNLHRLNAYFDVNVPGIRQYTVIREPQKDKNE